jgi:hypothetical protein
MSLMLTGSISVLAASMIAHIPVILTKKNASGGAAPTLPDGRVSFAFYGAVAGRGDTRSVQATMQAGQSLFAELLIPNLSPEKDLASGDLPSLTVVAPSGAEKVCHPNRREVFYERYTDTSYLSYLVERLPAESGVHTLTVAGHVPCRFALAVGDDESPGDVHRAAIGSVEDVVRWYTTGPEPQSA